MSIHHALTKIAIKLGPRNPFIAALIRRRCRRYGVEVVFGQAFLELRKSDRSMRISVRHFVYVMDLAQRFELYFSPVEPTESGGRRVVDYSTPAVQTYRRSRLQFEIASIPEEDEVIEDYCRFYRPGAGDLVFDIGANCGVSTYYLSKLVGPAGRVVAFEPDPLNHSILLRNIERHCLKNVVPVNAAIASTDGHLSFHSEGSIGSGLARNSSRASVGSVLTVKCMTLRTAFSTWGEPAFCKVDIEGAELDVIASSLNLLRGSKTHFVLDTNHIQRGALTSLPIEKLFRSIGFESFSDKSAGSMTTWAGPSL